MGTDWDLLVLQQGGLEKTAPHGELLVGAFGLSFALLLPSAQRFEPKDAARNSQRESEEEPALGSKLSIASVGNHPGKG